MKYNFNEIIERRGSSSFKWDWDKYSYKEVIPMWVADMDFKSPQPVLDALKERVDHGVFGYTFESEELNSAVTTKLKNEYNWEIDKNWIIWLPGLVCGINIVNKAIGIPGDEVLTTSPIYPPFLSAPSNSSKLIVTSQMVPNNDYWEIDFDDLENKISSKTRLLMLCNPHNPTGRVFNKKELVKLGKLAEKYNFIVCSDEIHCDLILDENAKHIPFASISPELANRTITLMAPSKTYNIAGLGCSFAIISNPDLKRKFQTAMNGIVPHVNLLGYTATLAAYTKGQEWLDQLLIHLRSNYEIIQDFVNKHEDLSVSKMEATYLAWIDVSKLNLMNPEQFFYNAGVGMSSGKDFLGNGYLRLNFGCSKSILLEALNRIDMALKTL